MTDPQIFRFFAIDRDEEGRPKPPQIETAPSDRSLFAQRCFLAGVHDRKAVARLWREELARRQEAAV